MDNSLASDHESNSLNLPTSCLTISSTSSASPRLQINGTEYEVVEQLPNKRGKTSWIWKEGLKLVDLSDRLKKLWMCRHCYDEGKNILYAMSSTAHASKHLNEVHQLFEAGTAPAATTLPINRTLQPSLDFAQFKTLLI